MNNIILPAVCKKCGKAFFITPLPIRSVNDKTPICIDEQTYPNRCPNKGCLGDAFIPSGIYEWEDNQIKLVEGSDYTQNVFKKIIETEKGNLVLYRYMNHEFVEKFKNEGILRICPLAVYQSIQDIRQDESEGTQINKFIGSGSLTSAQAKSILGVDVHSVNFEPGWDEATKFRRLLPAAYVLSTSTIQSNDLMKRFECDDYFIISNVVALKQAIERAISKYIEVQHSVDHHVEYNVDKDTHISIEELMNTDDSERSVDGMLYFRKTIGYITESEYRFVFVVESENPLPELYLKFTPDEIKASCQFRSDDAWISSNYAGIGRNDQCPCGSKKKFKRCHGKK